MAVNNIAEIVTPTGRLVQGSLYKPNDKDMDGNLLVYKSGDKKGQPRQEYFFRIAIPKGNETHWGDTPWGQIILTVGATGFPQQYQNPAFAWKIINGDSRVAGKPSKFNATGSIPAEHEGFPGHWILTFKSSNAPALFLLDDKKKTQSFSEKDGIYPGCYIQVRAMVSDNGSTQQPGIYLNPSMVCFRGHGERISVGVDPDSVGFGQDELPSGASLVPPGNYMPVATQAALPHHVAPLPHVAPIPQMAPIPVAVPPYHAVLTPTAPPAALIPAAPARQMTSKATFTYEQYISAGWTDAYLIQEGLMQI
jgi:hypothetical protein